MQEVLKTSSLLASFLMCLTWYAIPSQAFYLPGIAPHNYVEGETVDLKVNKLR